MSIRSSFKKWIVGFGALGSAMVFYPHENDNNQFTQTDKSRIFSTSWNYNWDRLYLLLLLLLLSIKYYFFGNIILYNRIAYNSILFLPYYVS